MKKFRMNSGTHVTGHGSEAKTWKVKKGKKVIVEADEDLDQLFPDRFERVNSAVTASEPTFQKPKVTEKVKDVEPPIDPEDAGPEDDEEDETEAPDGSLGKDVTEDFKKAVRADLKVFKKGKKFFVVDADEPNVPLEGAEGLKDKKEVDKYLASYLKRS